MKIVNIDQKLRPRRRVLERMRGVGVEEAAAVCADCLIASWLATGPIAIVCFAPSRVVTSRYGLKFWITPCCTMSSATNERRSAAARRACRARGRPRSFRAGPRLLTRDAANERDRDRHPDGRRYEVVEGELRHLRQVRHRRLARIRLPVRIRRERRRRLERLSVGNRRHVLRVERQQA